MYINAYIGTDTKPISIIGGTLVLQISDTATIKTQV